MQRKKVHKILAEARASLILSKEEGVLLFRL